MNNGEWITAELVQCGEAGEISELVPAEVVTIAGIPVRRLFAAEPHLAQRSAEFFRSQYPQWEHAARLSGRCRAHE
ncbi:MAG TPA: hypothetical protein VLI55_21110 [Bryobacteraceae bacterium]|nr:hypothetical protein [Bryobacteraceae bacterium]